MKVTLISMHPEIFSVGFRILSSCLKKANHEVQLIFIPGGDLYQPKGKRFVSDYKEKILSDIVDLCRDSDMIGISLLTNYFIPAIKLTEGLKAKLDTPIVWGGPHPTASPEECLKYTDIVCIGESEEALVDLANSISEGKSYENIPNIWSKNGDKIIRNNPRPLIQDLDSLPFPDCDIIGQYVLSNNELCKLDLDLIQQNSIFHTATDKGATYLVLSSRGCPHACTYCINALWRKLYEGQRCVRRSSVEKICDEINYAVGKIPIIKSINFADDNFSAMNHRQMESFLKIYTERVGLPFSCTLSPIFTDESRMDMLINAGVYRISMGIQSGSERILKMYARDRIPLEKTREAIKRLELVRPRMKLKDTVVYHFIIDNPYENVEDKTATLKFILDMPRRDSVRTFSLVPFPGTIIFDMMRKDGLIVDEQGQIFAKDLLVCNRSFTKYWLYMYYANVPKPFLKFLLKPGLIRMFDNGKPKWLFEIIYWGLEKGYQVLGKIRRILG